MFIDFASSGLWCKTKFWLNFIQNRSRLQTLIFNRFWINFGTIFGAKIASWTLPSGVQTAFGVHLWVRNASNIGSSRFGPPILGLSLVRNCFRINQKSKKTNSKSNFEFDTIFWSFFYQILINLEAKIESNFDQILR